MALNRRELMQSAVGLAATGMAGGVSQVQESIGADSPVERGTGGGPIVVASANGLRACTLAMERMRQGSDPLDALVDGVALVEDDPSDHSVGLGGLPNEEGVVELDASVMHGPTHKAGAVAALQRIRNPSRVALLVMRRTDHVLLVGEGALRFARAHGLREEDLLTDEARRIWLRWKETHSGNDDWLAPEAECGERRSSRGGVEFTWGTINCLALSESGDLAGVTSTSGLSYKIPGRVGDSPIIGAGLYVDNEVGAAGSTGRGEANLQNCTSFLVVERMRAGLAPEQACLEALRLVARRTEKRLRNAQGEPNYGLILYALRKDGLYGGASMRGEARMAIHDGREARHVRLPGVYAGG